jgi:hypothetical protein
MCEHPLQMQMPMFQAEAEERFNAFYHSLAAETKG